MPISRDDVYVDEITALRQQTIDELRQSLTDVDRVALGTLQSSIRVEVEHNDSIVSFIIYMDDYWKFVDKGVSGTKKKFDTPFSFKKKNINQRAALDFIAARGLYEWKDKTGKVVFTTRKKVRNRKTKAFRPKSDNYKTLGFLVGRSISNWGVKPTNFYSDVINEAWMNNFKERASKALKKDVQLVIEEIKETINGK